MDRTFVLDNSRSPNAVLKTIPMKNVKISGFMGKYLGRVVNTTIPYQYEILEKTGRIDNFRRASGKIKGDFQGFFFNDSDVYKWLEAASSALINLPSNNDLKQKIDAVIKEIEDAQDEDGYLNTFFTFDKKKDRWTDLANMHELYCAGHLIQAAILHKRVTGEDKLFNVARKFADHIASVFGENKKLGAPGHPEIEMALVELYRETRENKYLNLAKFFINNRGKGYAGGTKYTADHKPFKKLEEVVGHAVRMVYLCCGATDLYMENGDEELLKTLKKLWSNMTEKKMYITGGIGSRHEGEAFGEDYELPNKEAYAETCAAIANFMWNWRMFLLTANSQFVDLMEQTLYNGILPGISLDGKKYFYVNPLEADENHRRKEWYDCACCPTNIIRILTQFPGYIYAVSDEGIWVNFYEPSESIVDFGRKIKIVQKTEYPWSGKVEMDIHTEQSEEFSLFLRIPEWVKEDFEMRVNREKVDMKFNKGYLEIRRIWGKKDTLEIEFPMKVRLIKSHPMVKENIGKVAFKRGPIVYCFEQVDNKDIDPSKLNISHNVEAKYLEDLLGGVVVLDGEGLITEDAWKNRLYNSVGELKTSSKTVKFRLIPYFVWANREQGKMSVWLTEC
ncbi:MAG: glycoside hydrolase family 127 protein [Thermotogae bacterium]|nr:glycoside hydrolase family 127 protein [Thermotogota bacterium]